MEQIPLGEELVYHTKNGIPVYYSPNPALHSFCLSLFVRGGSMFESAKDNGITHFLEHLLFRHINNLKNGTLYRELDAAGLSFDGVTYREFLWFSICGAPCHLEKAVSILSLLFAPLTLTNEDIVAERNRVKAEIREDGEKTSLDFFTDNLLYKGTSLAQSILGTPNNLNRMTLRRLSAYKNTLFSKENVFFCVTGAANEACLTWLSEGIAPYPISASPQKENLAPVCAEMFKRNAFVAIKNSRRGAVRLSVDVSSTKCTDAELVLLYDILFGDGEECRLHKTLSEKTGYIYSFSASLEQYRNVSFIHILYEIPVAKLLESVALMLGLLTDAKKTVGESLYLAKAPYTDNAAFILDSARDFNWSLAYERHLLSLPYTSIEDRKKAFQAVTPERLCALAAEIFTPDCLSLTAKADKRAVSQDTLRALLLSV